MIPPTRSGFGLSHSDAEFDIIPTFTPSRYLVTVDPPRTSAIWCHAFKDMVPKEDALEISHEEHVLVRYARTLASPGRYWNKNGEE